LSGKNLAERIEQQEREFRLYSDAIALFASIRAYFQNYQFTVHVEPTVRTGPEARQLVPDLLVKTIAGWTVIEHKGSLPRSRKRLEAELGDISKYAQTTTFNNSAFNPQVVLLCPRKLADDIIAQKKSGLQLPNVISYTSPMERVCTLGLEEGELTDVYLKDIFARNSGRVNMDTDITERYKYKFIRREPPIPYTTHFIWAFINLSKDAFQKEVVVEYDKLIQMMNDFCPPWCAEARQLSEGRLKKAVSFLKRLGWVKFDADTKRLTADTSRGTKVGRLEEYLCEKFVKQSEEIPTKQLERKSPEQLVGMKRLEEYFPKQS